MAGKGEWECGGIDVLWRDEEHVLRKVLKVELNRLQKQGGPRRGVGRLD